MRYATFHDVPQVPRNHEPCGGSSPGKNVFAGANLGRPRVRPRPPQAPLAWGLHPHSSLDVLDEILGRDVKCIAEFEYEAQPWGISSQFNFLDVSSVHVGACARAMRLVPAKRKLGLSVACPSFHAAQAATPPLHSPRSRDTPAEPPSAFAMLRALPNWGSWFPSS